MVDAVAGTSRSFINVNCCHKPKQTCHYAASEDKPEEQSSESKQKEQRQSNKRKSFEETVSKAKPEKFQYTNDMGRHDKKINLTLVA